VAAPAAAADEGDARPGRFGHGRTVLGASGRPRPKRTV
jgi:hypothetical protein